VPDFSFGENSLVEAVYNPLGVAACLTR